MGTSTYSGAASGGQQVVARWCAPAHVAEILAKYHYLGPLKRGEAWQSEHGVICVAPPTSRRLPTNWLELTRWCITSEEKNAGSRMWAAFIRDLRARRHNYMTTVVSYSDPSVGHTGALYRACNWWWAPTWHRLRPPPSGNGNWNDRQQSVKDRWVFPVTADDLRTDILLVKDEAVLRRMPWARYTEPGGADYKTFKEQAL